MYVALLRLQRPTCPLLTCAAARHQQEEDAIKKHDLLKEAMTKGFLATDEALREKKAILQGTDCGSTCVAIFITPTHFVIANLGTIAHATTRSQLHALIQLINPHTLYGAGDSRCVIGRKCAEAADSPTVWATTDQKPTDVQWPPAPLASPPLLVSHTNTYHTTGG